MTVPLARPWLADFGDNWQFTVKLEGIEAPGKRRKLPQLLEKHGKAPAQYPDEDWDDE